MVYKISKSISPPRVTPLQSAVKRRVSRALDRYDECWHFMPVQTGYGSPVLDYIVCIRGRFIAIETKREGGKLTARQHEIARELVKAGALVYVICGTQQADDWAKDVLPKLVSGDFSNATQHSTLYREEEFYNLQRETSE